MSRFKGYAYTLAAIAGVTLLGWLLRSFLSSINLALLYLPVIVLSATLWGLGPTIFASVLSVLILDAIFVPPYGFISISSPQDIVTYGAFLVVGIVTSQLSGLVREQVNLAQARERQNAALYALSQEIAFRTDRAWILDAALRIMNTFFSADARIFLANGDEQLQPYGAADVLMRERTMAQWVYRRGELERAPGLGGATFVPMETAQAKYGVLVLRHVAREGRDAVEERHALEAFAAQIALALEHVKLSEQLEEARLHEASERFSEALLASLSHDLRTPLTAIVGSTSTYLDPTVQLDAAARNELVLTIHNAATRLNRLVSNLVEMTRLGAGGLKPQRAWNSIAEVVEAALSHVNTDTRPVELAIPSDLPLVSFDFVLVEEVMVNLVDNASKFSPPHTPIEISARVDDECLQVQVTDCGVGIPSDELTRIFEKHYRVKGNGHVPGSGLGLLICKGIVEAHGGKIWAEGNNGGGTSITFTLPAAERVRVE